MVIDFLFTQISEKQNDWMVKNVYIYMISAEVGLMKIPIQVINKI